MKHVKDLIGKARNRIRLVGVELEGGWNKLPAGVELTHDGSVAFRPPPRPPEIQALIDSRDPLERERGYKLFEKWEAHVLKDLPKKTGELPSHPMSAKDINEWMRKYYPSHTNVTCGMHVHMSFNTRLTYQRLMTPDYERAVVELFKEWAAGRLPEDHPIWPRLRGENQYCRIGQFMADAQVRATQKGYNRQAPVNRYTAIHYALGTHGTIECRLLPMMPTVDVACEAIHYLLSITNAFILSRIKDAIEEKKAVERVEVLDTFGDEREEVNLCV